MEQVHTDIKDEQSEGVSEHNKEPNPIVPIETPQIDEDELRQFTRDYSPVARRELSYKIRMTRIRRELGIIEKEEESESIAKLQADFNDRFNTMRNRFNKEAEDIRDVETISKNKSILFVHTIPLYGVDQEGNTQMNNGVVKTGLLSTEERIGLIICEKPSISCSTVDLQSNAEYGFNYSERDTMYPFGVVIDKGTILAAHRFDAGTVAISRKSKHRKYDRNEPDTSIQPKIGAQIEHAIEGPFSKEYDQEFRSRYGHIDGTTRTSSSNYNEITVAEPSVAGFYLDEDFMKERERISSDGTNSKWRSAIEAIFKRYPNVPIYIQKDNQTQEYIWTEENGLEPVLTPGKIDRKVPNKRLESYIWTTSELSKITTKEKQHTVHYLFDTIKELILKTYTDKLTRVTPSIELDFNSAEKALEKLILLFKEGAISDEELYIALDKDIGGYIRKNKEKRAEMKLKIATTNDSIKLGESGMYQAYENENQVLYGILNALALEIEQIGREDLASRIRTIGR